MGKSNEIGGVFQVQQLHVQLCGDFFSCAGDLPEIDAADHVAWLTEVRVAEEIEDLRP
jgi:hypothetical protein